MLPPVKQDRRTKAYKQSAYDYVSPSDADMRALRGEFDPERNDYVQANGEPGLTNAQIADRLKISRWWVHVKIGAQPDDMHRPSPPKPTDDPERDRLRAAVLALRGVCQHDTGKWVQANGDPGLTVDEIVDRLSISRSKVYRLLADAPKKLTESPYTNAPSQAELVALRGVKDPATKRWVQANGEPGLTLAQLHERFGLYPREIYRILGDDNRKLGAAPE